MIIEYKRARTAKCPKRKIFPIQKKKSTHYLEDVNFPLKEKMYTERVIKNKGNECWGWKGYKNMQGYAAFQANRTYVSAHVFSWTINNGDIPQGMYVCHYCDNKDCSRPECLFISTNRTARCKI